MGRREITSPSKLDENSTPQVVDHGDGAKPQFKADIVWFNAIGFVLLHLACLYGLYLHLIGSSQFATGVWSVSIGLLTGVCVTMGAHRLWSHRSFKATLPLRIILLLGHTMAGQNSLWVWVRDHRQHHKYCDTDADPHDSRRGFWFSHIGWLMMKKHPEVIAKGKLIDMSDIEADPLIMIQKKYYKLLYVIFAFFIPVLVPYYFWNEKPWNCLFSGFFTWYILMLNFTWCVNSVAHLWGTRPYSNGISPVESNFVSFFGLGEGWHNYHHTFPWDCNASEFGKHFNPTSRLLHLFAKYGLAYDLRQASPDMVKHRIEKSGDGTHPLTLRED